MTSADEAAAFTSGMEHESKSCDTTVLRFKLDAVQSRIEQIWVSVSKASEAAMSGMKAAMKAVGARGPDPDYNEDEERILVPVRMLEQAMKPRYKNGGGDDDDEGIKRWHLVLAVLGVVIPIVGAAWSLSMQISAQSAMISNIRDHQREQDERATRVEQQLQQLSRDRR